MRRRIEVRTATNGVQVIVKRKPNTRDVFLEKVRLILENEGVEFEEHASGSTPPT